MSQPTNVVQQYQSKSVFISSGSFDVDQTVAGSLQQLTRVTDCSWNINYPLSDNVYIDGGMEPAYVTPPSIDVTVGFYHTNGTNERFMGLAKFDNTGQLILGLDQEKSLYISVEDEAGIDAIGASQSAARTVIGMAQATLSSYQLAAQVGGLIRAEATFNCLTAFVYTGSSGQHMAAVDPQNGEPLTGQFVLPSPSSQYIESATGTTGLFINTAAIGGQDMIMMFPKNSPFGVTYTGTNAVYLQGVDLSMVVQRQDVKPLGYVFPEGRGIIYPIEVSLNTEAIVSRYQADQLQRFACATNTGFSINVVVKQPCSAITMFGFYFTDMQLVSQSFGNSVGSMDTVTSQWRGWLKSPQDTFIDPWLTTIVRLDTTGAWGESW